MWACTCGRRSGGARTGRPVGYVQLAHNRRVDGVTRAEVLVNLGREDELDLDGLRRLAASITRFTDGDGGGRRCRARRASSRSPASRPMGGVWLLDGLWRALGVDRALARVLGARRFSTDVERVLFALVANRALDPCSKLAAAEWASPRRPHPRPGRRWTRTRPTARWTCSSRPTRRPRSRRRCSSPARTCLNLEVDLLFFDTTSTYFERDEPETRRGRRAGVPRLRALQGPPARPAAGRDRPRRHPRGDPGPRVGAGPATPTTCRSSQRSRTTCAAGGSGRVVTVVDRGFSSDENLRYLHPRGRALDRRRADARRHPPTRRRRSRARAATRPSATTCASRRSASATATRPSASSSATTPPRPSATAPTASDTIARLRGRARPDRRGQRAKAKSAKAAGAHHRAECALRDHPDARALPAPDPVRPAADRPRQDRAPRQRLDGKYLLSTSDPDLSAEDVALGYKNLLEAERGFRDLKTTLELRPVFHRLEHRIRAHVLICWLALLLIRVAERQTGHTWRRIALELAAPAPRHLQGRRHRPADDPLTDTQRDPRRARDPRRRSPPPARLTRAPAGPAPDPRRVGTRRTSAQSP